MRDIVYFDLETQRTANDAGGWDRKGNMQMSIGVIYSDARAAATRSSTKRMCTI